MSSIPVWVRNAIVVIAATIVVVALTFCGRVKAEVDRGAYTAFASAPVTSELSPPRVCIGPLTVGARLAAAAKVGGAIGLATDVPAQSLSDASRRAAGKPPGDVAMVIILIQATVIVAEFGPDGCLIDMLRLDIGTFSDILDAMPKVSQPF